MLEFASGSTNPRDSRQVKKLPTAEQDAIIHAKLKAERAARRLRRYPRPDADGKLPEYEPLTPRSLDFENRDTVDWSGYYTDGEKAPDYE